MPYLFIVFPSISPAAQKCSKLLKPQFWSWASVWGSAVYEALWAGMVLLSSERLFQPDVSLCFETLFRDPGLFSAVRFQVACHTILHPLHSHLHFAKKCINAFCGVGDMNCQLCASPLRVHFGTWQYRYLDLIQAWKYRAVAEYSCSDAKKMCQPYQPCQLFLITFFSSQLCGCLLTRWRVGSTSGRKWEISLLWASCP